MIDNLGKSSTLNFGPQRVLAFARFNGAAAAATNMTLLDQFGIFKVVQASTGLFVVTLQEKSAEFIPDVRVVSAAADLHDLPVTATDFVNGTFSFAHYLQTARTGAHALNNGVSPAAVFNITVFARGSL
jgi:hypothetical protein